MHFYKFNIGDYSSHTNHLSESEDLAYRRMLDYCYLNEIGLPETIEEIGRLIRMRTHSDCIANVLREFFYFENSSYKNKRVEIDLFDYHSKSDKAAESAKARWAKHKEISDTNALRTECEGNAKQEPLTTKQEPLTIITTAPAKAVATVKPKTEYNAKDLISVGVEESVARDFLINRSKQKAPLTETALKAIVREAEKAGLTLSQAIQVTTERGWRSFKAEYVMDKQSGQYITFYELATGRKPEF